MAKRTTLGSGPVYGVARPGTQIATQVIAWFTTRSEAERARVDGTEVVEGESVGGQIYLLGGDRFEFPRRVAYRTPKNSWDANHPWVVVLRTGSTFEHRRFQSETEAREWAGRFA